MDRKDDDVLLSSDLPLTNKRILRDRRNDLDDRFQSVTFNQSPGFQFSNDRLNDIDIKFC